MHSNDFNDESVMSLLYFGQFSPRNRLMSNRKMGDPEHRENAIRVTTVLNENRNADYKSAGGLKRAVPITVVKRVIDNHFGERKLCRTTAVTCCSRKISD